jgi:hypothetical protein
VASRELVQLVVLHPVATGPDDVACGRIEEGAIGSRCTLSVFMLRTPEMAPR